MILRPYQTQLAEDARALRRAGTRSVLLQAPTGAGKTVIAAHILASAVARGSKPWVLCHRVELIEQICQALRIANCPYWVSKAGHSMHPRETPGRGVMVGSVQTVGRRIQPDGSVTRLTPPGLIVWDECHHIAAGSWEKIYRAFPRAVHLGLSATPRRLDGSGLGAFFDAMIQGPSTAELISIGALAPYRIFAPPPPDLRGVHIRAGEYVASEAEKAVRSVTGNILEHYRAHADGRQALVFCVSRTHSKEVAAMFVAAGIPAAHVDAETPREIRSMCMAEFRERKLRVICNVDLFGEGVDLPGVGALIMLRPTMSEGLYLQQIGRSLRPAPGKEYAVILDHVGNVTHHGLPDAARTWSLTGNSKKTTEKREAVIRVRVCPKCFAAQTPSPACRFCGEIFEMAGRRIETRAGELVEIGDLPVASVAAKRGWGNREQLTNMFKHKGLSEKIASALAARIERKRATGQGAV